ncbi:hypothetical protein ACFYYH_04350 [Streptomyces sp. NPDC002018]|uniref:hypothetical protein n=1 Tax=Streptomyces sp. NPDC002018 TaxID=3364629 RepID=UPI0036B9E750
MSDEAAPLTASPATPPPGDPAGRPLAKSARKPVGRRGTGDPVKGLLHRYRELCERAVDPLEIAAVLEAHGITDRTAARFRHRDVFALADELYARVPHGTSGRTPARTAHGTGARVGWWAVVALLPGAVACLTLVGLERGTGQGRLAIGLAGALALTGALSACLRRGPLRAGGRTVPAAGLWVYWLLAYLVCGDGLLDELVGGGPDGPWPATVTPLAALACAVVPAAWCARLFSVGAGRRLADSHGLAEFSARVRPLLLALVGLYVCALTALTTGADLVFAEDGRTVPTVALGTLLLLARLLTVHGLPGPATAGLAAACAVEILSCASVLAGRLPGFEPLAVPVTHAVRMWGSSAVPALACGAAALVLLLHAAVALSRASAHTRPQPLVPRRTRPRTTATPHGKP